MKSFEHDQSINRLSSGSSLSWQLSSANGSIDTSLVTRIEGLSPDVHELSGQKLLEGSGERKQQRWRYRLWMPLELLLLEFFLIDDLGAFLERHHPLQLGRLRLRHSGYFVVIFFFMTSKQILLSWPKMRDEVGLADAYQMAS